MKALHCTAWLCYLKNCTAPSRLLFHRVLPLYSRTPKETVIKGFSCCKVSNLIFYTWKTGKLVEICYGYSRDVRCKMQRSQFTSSSTALCVVSNSPLPRNVSRSAVRARLGDELISRRMGSSSEVSRMSKPRIWKGLRRGTTGGEKGTWNPF